MLPNGFFVASCGDGTIRVWNFVDALHSEDPESVSQVAAYKLHRRDVRGFAQFHQNPFRFASASYDKTAKIVDIIFYTTHGGISITFDEVGVLKATEDDMNNITVSYDDQFVYCVSGCADLFRWSVSDPANIFQTPKGLASVTFGLEMLSNSVVAVAGNSSGLLITDFSATPHTRTRSISWKSTSPLVVAPCPGFVLLGNCNHNPTIVYPEPIPM
jgi:WD40 repeat protein